MEKTDAPRVRIELVHAWPERCWSHRVELAPGATVGDALAAASGPMVQAGIDPALLGLAVFGRTASAATRLRDGDRIELLRPLQASPRQARANRAAAARRRTD